MYRIAARSAALLGLYFAGALLGQTLRRPLVIDESRYRVVAGERISIEAPAETVTFMRSARDADRPSIEPDFSGRAQRFG